MPVSAQVAPLRAGIYYIRHVSARLGSYDLRIPVVADRLLQRVADAHLGTAAHLRHRVSAGLGPAPLELPGRGGFGAGGGGGLAEGLGTGNVSAALARMGQVGEGACGRGVWGLGFGVRPSVVAYGGSSRSCCIWWQQQPQGP